jgi:transposase
VDFTGFSGYCHGLETHSVSGGFIMQLPELFTQALGLTLPWQVVSYAFSKETNRLDINIDFTRGAKFPCPVCGDLVPVHDTVEKTWRHMNFWQYESYLTARIPRVKCPKEGCGVRLAQVPWARPGSGFTLLFEALTMVLAREMPVNIEAAFLGEHGTRLWRVLHHYVDDARSREDFSNTTSLGMDETSAKCGQDYIMLTHDMEAKKLIFATPGKDHTTVEAFAEDFKLHKGKVENITSICIDMSKAFIKGITETFPNAIITFDPFHVIQGVNKALGEVRAADAKLYPGLMKGSRFAYLKNPENLTEKQDGTLTKLSNYNLKTGRAYLLKLALQDVYFAVTREDGEVRLKSWYSWAIRSQIEPMKKVAKTVKAHWDGILAWFDSQLSNGYVEAINGLIQTAKRRARGYKTTRNLITMSYLIAGKLDFRLPATH